MNHETNELLIARLTSGSCHEKIGDTFTGVDGKEWKVGEIIWIAGRRCLGCTEASEAPPTTEAKVDRRSARPKILPFQPVVAVARPSWCNDDDEEWTEAVAAQGVIYSPREFFASDNWSLTKAEWLTGRCCMCGRTDRPTTLHHNTYARLGFEWRSDFAETCWPCHDWYHQKHEAAA